MLHSGRNVSGCSIRLYLTTRVKFSVLQPSAPVGTGPDSVFEILQDKHPLPWPLKAGDLPNFLDFPKGPPPFSALGITDELISATGCNCLVQVASVVPMATPSRVGSLITVMSVLPYAWHSPI